MTTLPHGTPTGDELREVLLALSVASLRLAKQLEKPPKKPAMKPRYIHTVCPFYREWRRDYEAL